MKRKKRSRRCDYQCNVPPNKQSWGTQRCKNVGAKLMKLKNSEWYQHRCHIHRHKKYNVEQEKM